MKLKFGFMPILTGNWLTDTPSKANKNCLPFPCFSCKYYDRGNLLELDEFIIDINYTVALLGDRCVRTEGFTNIEYDEVGNVFCDQYLKDRAMSIKL